MKEATRHRVTVYQTGQNLSSGSCRVLESEPVGCLKQLLRVALFGLSFLRRNGKQQTPLISGGNGQAFRF